jgi:hypothetical protein
MGSVITVILIWFEMIIFLGTVSDIVNVPNIASSTLLPLVEENTDRRVFLVSPDVTVASPPYRYRQGPALHLHDQQLRGALFD